METNYHTESGSFSVVRPAQNIIENGPDTWLAAARGFQENRIQPLQEYRPSWSDNFVETNKRRNFSTEERLSGKPLSGENLLFDENGLRLLTNTSEL